MDLHCGGAGGDGGHHPAGAHALRRPGAHRHQAERDRSGHGAPNGRAQQGLREAQKRAQKWRSGGGGKDKERGGAQKKGFLSLHQELIFYSAEGGEAGGVFLSPSSLPPPVRKRRKEGGGNGSSSSSDRPTWVPLCSVAKCLPLSIPHNSRSLLRFLRSDGREGGDSRTKKKCCERRRGKRRELMCAKTG